MPETGFSVQSKMIETIGAYLSNINKDLAVFLMSLVPVVELRGAIPFAIGALGMNWLRAYVISVIGNMLPVPFLIWLIRPIVEWLLRTKTFSKLGSWLDERTRRKSKSVTKYKKLGLLIFVAIPLPGTGAWSGAMIAGLLDMRIKDALPAIFGGVLIAGLLVVGITCGFGALLNLA